ncbi:folliculin [Clonorchis sinensis]|uniref:Folliculin n=1 Tax=Clonorchis sinensis TaxID=79923 RepID=G7YWZ5_CLOSI|nr:folliculin [Clonorchis sinensis]
MQEGIFIPEPKEDFLRPSVELIIDRIRFAIHRRGVRVVDFFVDYDKLRHDAVTENQFVCALMLAIAKEAQLSREEVQMLANCYRKHSNPRMIAYREFCRQVDAPFHTLHLEKDPLKQPNMPKTGELTRGVATLTTEEEQRVSRILDDLRAKVEKRRIMTCPYFRDYDLGTGITGIVSDTQFGRVLHFLGLTVSPEDCRLLCRKFAEPTTGKVSYTLFCQAIDAWSIPEGILKPDDTSACCVEQENINFGVAIGDSKSGKKVSRRDWLSTVEPHISSVGDHWPVEVLLDRIRHLVLINRIGLKPWFHDFDQLRSGYMTRSQFARCLTAAGIMRLDLHDLTPTQLNTLADRYVSPNDSNMVNWTKFVEDVETVFTIPELEKQPLTRVLPQETFVQPKPGTADWSTATTEMRENYEDSMSKLRRKIHERRMLLLPDFLAFDKNHRGYVTTNNFRQLVTMFDFSISPAGIDAIIARHANDDGFDYRGFLGVLDPPSPGEVEYKYPERLKTLQMANIIGKKRREMEPVLRDTEGVLDQIKAEVYRRRIRLSDWFRDHDKLNHGYMPRSTFRRCLGVLPLSIGETAMNMVEDRMTSEDSTILMAPAITPESLMHASTSVTTFLTRLFRINSLRVTSLEGDFGLLRKRFAMSSRSDPSEEETVCTPISLNGCLFLSDFSPIPEDAACPGLLNANTSPGTSQQPLLSMRGTCRACTFTTRDEPGLVSPGPEGAFYFGDEINGHVVSYNFGVKDSQARGFQGRFSILVLSWDRLYLLNLWPFLISNLSEMASRIKQAAERVFVSETSGGAGTSASRPVATNAHPSREATPPAFCGQAIAAGTATPMPVSTIGGGPAVRHRRAGDSDMRSLCDLTRDEKLNRSGEGILLTVGIDRHGLVSWTMEFLPQGRRLQCVLSQLPFDQ